ncbi:MAG: glycoside hydrolase family 13 protein [Clostridiales bacterium]|jgi:glycosidase|nr:glycoside hydrolase family 13 protein [Clostridiales bacterium]
MFSNDFKRCFLHVPDSKFCFAESSDTVVLRVRVNRGCNVEKMSVVYGCKYDYNKERQETPLKKIFTDDLYDWYSATLKVSDVRLVYVFKIQFEGKTCFYSEDGITDDYNFVLNYLNAFQLPYVNSIDVPKIADWYRSAVFYEIFPERFKNGAGTKKPYITMKWDEKPSWNSYAGGDLIGITKSMDYIKNLGINAIYLTPVFESPTNHKYEIIDYYSIDSQLGTNADFRELVEVAHSRGIRVVLDAVFNHCGVDFRLFKDVCEKGTKSDYYDWFIVKGEKPDIKKVNYETFAHSAGMPKLNLSNSDTQEYFLRVSEHWIREYDIDGWRLDVADEVAHDFWRAFRKRVKALKADAVIIGENWHDSYPFLRGEQFDGIMNYSFTKACMDYFIYDRLDATGLAERLSGLLMRNTTQANAMMLNLLDSHDTHRFFTLAKENAKTVQAALALTFLFVGAPCVYYGTEVDMIGEHDPDNRRGMDWTKTETRQETTEVIKKLALLRQKDIIKYGDISLYAEEDIFVLERNYQQHQILLKITKESFEIAEK